MSGIVKTLRRAAGWALAAALLAGGAVWATAAALPDTFYVSGEGELQVASMPWVTVRARTASTARVGSTNRDTSQNVTLTLLGLPVKTVRTVQTARRTVQVCGTPFGVKMFSDGALVVAFSDRYTALGVENPAKEAGLRLGDLIVSAGGHTVRTNDELSAAIAAAQGQPVTVVYRRDGTEHTTSLTPVADRTTGDYKAGVWVRDSSAGLGTMTFIDPANGSFAGLGHSVSDTDTGADISLLKGEIVPVVITGCVSGAAGAPGELRGEFSGSAAGTVLANDTTGVYGAYTGPTIGQAMEVAQNQEVETGEAELWTTISGSTVRRYTVRIERVSLTASDPNRNIRFLVTDDALLAASGGVVQGMSGSPLVQNGRLVGAVTHVLVNDPTRGYAIFAATMLEKADSVQ